MAEIFLSYSKQDLEKASELARVLEEQGWSVFWDRRIPAGQTWRSYIEEALSSARCVIVAWSNNSISSRWVIEEADIGVERNCLVPVLFDKVMPPVGFRSIQAAELFDWRANKQNHSFDQFISDVRCILNPEHVDSPPKSEQTPTKIDANKNSPSGVKSWLHRNRVLTISINFILLIILGGVWGYREYSKSNLEAHLNRLWKAEVYDVCKNTISGRYPVKKETRREISLHDFDRFFSESGTVAMFMNSYLEPLGIRYAGKTLLHSSDSSIELSPKAIQMLNYARDIRTMFYSTSKKLGISFHLKPIYLDANVTRFVLEINGAKLIYRHGPQRVTNVEWPGATEAQRTSLLFESTSGNRITNTRDGPWGWFRLLDQSKVEKSSRDRYKITFSGDDVKSKYEMRMSSLLNPFVGNQLASFVCEPDIIKKN